MTKNMAIAIAFLTGLGMIFIGARFLIAPETAEAGYGIHFNEQGDYSFHYIKGIRDLFSGLILCILVLTKQTKALAITLLVGTIIPTMDMFIVLSKDYNGLTEAIPHIPAIIVCSLSGVILLRNEKEQKAHNKGFINIIQSADKNQESIIEFNIVPDEKTPWHYHTLFSETFEVLKGTLEVGRNGEVNQLNEGDKVTIKPNEKHYFNNISRNECLIKVTVSPGNKNFENALLFSKGLAKDGLASITGTPKEFKDLALFIYLNNSRMVGFKKVAEPIFKYVAKAAIKRGHLNKLVQKYCNETT